MSLRRGVTPHYLFSLLPQTKTFPPFPLHPHLERQLMSMASHHLAGIIVGQCLQFA